jgi:hypothetical protein
MRERRSDYARNEIALPRRMPVVFRHKGFRFAFYANEGNPREPPHVHAIKDGIDAKFWLSPEVSVA